MRIKSLTSQNKKLKTTINIKILFQELNEKTMTQLLEDVDITNCLDEGTGTERNSLLLRKLTQLLNQDYNLQLENKEISYYLKDDEIYVNCGIDPVNEDVKIAAHEYAGQFLEIRAKNLGLSMVHRMLSFQQTIPNTDELQNEEFVEDQPGKGKCRRTKQRRIGYIIEKVIEWRKYYSGTSIAINHSSKYSLDEAANQVKISKKSLDDYLFQIRYGFNHGFNFNEHYNDKVGVLRDFVRQKKKVPKADIKSKKAYDKRMEEMRQR